MRRTVCSKAFVFEIGTNAAYAPVAARPFPPPWNLKPQLAGLDLHRREFPPRAEPLLNGG